MLLRLMLIVNGKDKKTTRKSVSGWLIYLCDCIIGWVSRSQKTLELSSSSDEYISMNEVCKEVLFIKNILESLKLRVKLPIIIMCYNVGEIYISKNNEIKRTKYLDVKYHFIREYIENGVIKIIFFKSKDIMNDPIKMNLSLIFLET